MIGGLAKAGFAGIDGDSLWPVATAGKAIPELLFACFQMSFAAITGALVIGALVERVRFSAMHDVRRLLVTIVYAPIAHMVWSPDGLMFQIGCDRLRRRHGGAHQCRCRRAWSGSGFAGPRIGILKEAMPPHSLALMLVGAGLLWVGWFGFNAGSALEANGLAAVAMVNTFVAPAAGMLGWMGIERLVSGKPSMLGGASGAVAGLVAVTPAAGVSGPVGAMVLGALASVACYAFVASAQESAAARRQPRRVRIHGLGGIVGSIGTALRRLAGARRTWRRRTMRWPPAGRPGRGGRHRHRLVGGGSAVCFASSGWPCRCATTAMPSARASTSATMASAPTIIELAPLGPPELAIPLRRGSGMVGTTNGRPADA